MTDELKQCRKCNEWKACDLFRNDRTRKDGKFSYCKACDKKREHVYYAENRDMLLEKKRAYSATHSDQAKDRSVQWREKNREKHRAASSQWSRDHPEQVRERSRRMSREYPEQIRGYKKRWRDANKETIRRWRENNAAKVQAYFSRRRAREKVGQSYTAGEWRALCDWFENVCVRCGASGPMSPDHVVPLAKDGSNLIFNIQPLCRPCNRQKHVAVVDYRDRERLNAFLDTIDDIKD